MVEAGGGDGGLAVAEAAVAGADVAVEEDFAADAAEFLDQHAGEEAVVEASAGEADGGDSGGLAGAFDDAGKGDGDPAMEAGGEDGGLDALLMFAEEAGEHGDGFDEPEVAVLGEFDGVAAVVGVAGDAFELDGGLGLVIDDVAVEDDGRDGVEETSATGGEGASFAFGEELEKQG